MKLCKNHGELPDTDFFVRKSGFSPHLCRACERESARAARKRRYTTPDGRAAIARSNAAWRKPTAPVVPSKPKIELPPEEEIFAAVRLGGLIPELKETPESIYAGLSPLKMAEPLPQNLIGLNYLDNVFPHRFDACTAGLLSFNGALASDNEIRKVIKYLVNDGRYPTRKAVLRNLQFNVNTPAHFFASAATAVLNEHGKGKSVYDPFIGWGGRTLGAFCAEVKSIIGTDTQQLSVDGANRIARDFSHVSQTVGEFKCQDSIEFMRTTDQRFDLIFTSPPFGWSEDYGEGVQSYRHWTESILIPLGQESKRIIRPGGIVAIHGQDRKSLPVLSMILGTFMSSGFKLISESRYGKRENQKILIFQGTA